MSIAEVNPEAIREIGGWPVRRYLGSGGFSWVFEVYDQGLRVSRALKLLKPEAAKGEGYKRFWREAQILAAIDDPHLVRIYELDHDPERKLPYYVMELLAGSDLAKLLKDSVAERRPLAVPRVVEIFLGTLQGLARLHELRPIIVHRDIKPANIWIADNGRAKLLDLGIAHVTRAGDDTIAHSVLTVEAGFIGTIRYASPEQLLCSELGPASDVFSLGLCLLETLEGYHPYKGIADLSSQTYPVVLSYYTRLQTKRASIDLRFNSAPKPLRAVVRRALSVRPEDRYRDAAEMGEALERAIRPEATREPKSAAPRRLPIALAATAGVVLLLVTGVDSWRWLAPEMDTSEREGSEPLPNASSRATSDSAKHVDAKRDFGDRNEVGATYPGAAVANAPSTAEVEQPPLLNKPTLGQVPPEVDRKEMARVIPAEPSPPTAAANLRPRLLAREPREPSLRIRPGEPPTGYS